MVDSSMIWRYGLVLGLLAPLAGCGAAVSDPQPSDEALAWRKALGGDAKAGGGEVKKEEAPDNDGHADLKGSFRFVGDAPQRQSLTIDKDNAVCSPGGKQVMTEDLVVDPATKGIANFLIFVEKAPEKWVHESAQAAAADALFDQKECVFLSHTFAVQVGQKMQIKNSDPIAHNALFAPPGNVPFNGTIPAGQESVYIATKATGSPVPVKCTIHSWMSANMIVRDNGYFAVSKPNGEFEMKNVPAGVDVTFRIWVEKGGFVNKPGVKLNGSDQPVKSGRFTFKLTKDAPNKMDLEFPAAVFE